VEERGVRGFMDMVGTYPSATTGQSIVVGKHRRMASSTPLR
jgi:hypothetical protein